MTDKPQSPGELFARVNRRLSEALPAYLPSRRWFGDKARQISAVDVVATFPIDDLGMPAAFSVVEVAFIIGQPARYVLPIVVVPASGTVIESISSIEFEDSQGYICDALLEPGFRTWLLQTLIDGSELRAGTGRLHVDLLGDAPAVLAALRDAPSRVLGVEQSNSSIVYGSGAFIKLFRRLQPGVNPDAELTRFLTAKSNFGNVPRYLGAITYESAGGEPTVVAVAQAFVDATADGWSFVLEVLRSHLNDDDARALIEESRAVARRLGEVTAGMHLALAADPWTPDLAAEPIRAEDAERWSNDYLAMLDAVAAGVARAATDLDTRTAELAAAFLDLVPGLRKRVAGFGQLIGRAKSRVHGDYHLGQTLRTAKGDFMVIDFEGEPQRAIVERRRKTSPLKDVAGMLRSFGYARGTAQSWLTEGTGLLPSDLVAWERTMKHVFLAAYAETARAGGATFLPRSDADLQAAIEAWELDKAVYEVQYELNNRPDWLWIPLSAMIKQGEPTN